MNLLKFLGPVSFIISGALLIAEGVTKLTPSSKDDEVVKQVKTIVEKLGL